VYRHGRTCIGGPAGSGDPGIRQTVLGYRQAEPRTIQLDELRASTGGGRCSSGWRDVACGETDRRHRVGRRPSSPRAMLQPMGRPTSKSELMPAAEQGFDRLWETVGAVSPSDRETPGACESWSVKDILAHLDAWHGMWLRWEQSGVRGEPTPMPAEGFTWAQTPDLNARIHADTAGDPSRSWSVEEVRIPG
jgi:hypothetical protein